MEVIGKKAKLTSVNRLLILCIVPNIKETYDNIKTLFGLININKTSFKFVLDFKIMLIVNGQQTATAMYPCPYCFVSLKSLRSSATTTNADVQNVINEEDIVVPNADNQGLKTFGNFRNDYTSFCLLGKIKKHAKECHSTINPPLFNEDDNIYIIQKCVIPELHILQGCVNHLFWNGLVPLVGRQKALIWPRKI